MPRGDADRIRQYALEHYIEPARRAGERRVVVRASDVHKALGLGWRYANVCHALDGDKFHRQAGVKIVDYKGPPSRRGPSAEFVFSILPQPGHEQANDWRRRGLELPARREQADDWRRHIMELPLGEFQGLIGDYLKAKGFSDAEVEIVIRLKGQE